MLKVKYIDGTVEEFNVDMWDTEENYTDLIKEVDGKEKIVATIFNRNVLSIQ